MAKEATLQVRMDAELKEQAELLYKQLGTSFAEAVRIFAKQSVEDRAMPFTMHLSSNHPQKRLGIADTSKLSHETIKLLESESTDVFYCQIM